MALTAALHGLFPHGLSRPTFGGCARVWPRNPENMFSKGSTDSAVAFSRMHQIRLMASSSTMTSAGQTFDRAPKMGRAVEIGGNRIPPPCIWIMPERGQGPAFNWDGRRQRRFPAVLLSAFNVDAGNASVLTGYIGFHQGVRGIRTTVASRFGPGRLTTFRSSK